MSRDRDKKQTPESIALSLRQLLRRLPASHPIRQAAESFLAAPAAPLEPTSFTLLFRALTNPEARHWRERMIAAWALCRATLTPQQARNIANTLLDILNDQLPGDTREERQQGYYRWLWYGTLPALTFFVVMIFVRALPGEENLLFGAAMGTLLVAAASALRAVIGMARLDLDDWRINRVRVAAVEGLGLLQMPETVGALAFALGDLNLRLRAAAEAALFDTLPRLTFDHYGSLDRQAVPNLCRVLSHPRQELVVRVLEALEKVGDGRALPFVQRLDDRPADTAFRELAARVLTTLQERKRLEDDRRMLLRGSTSPNAAPSLLLRSSHGSELAEMLPRPAVQSIHATHTITQNC